MLNQTINDLSNCIVAGLIKEGKYLALAESCTGGLLASAITSVPGSSKCFGFGVVSYSNEAKERVLSVSARCLNSFGAVSKETALEMARGLKSLSGADMALSVTGIAGPDGGTKEKPVGLVYFGLSFKGGEDSFRHQFRGSREEIRLQAVEKGLEILKTALK